MAHDDITPEATATDPATELLNGFVHDSDPRLLGALFTLTAGPLLKAALRITRDRDLAEDAVQETFFAVYRGTAKFHCEQRALPWLRGVVARMAHRQTRPLRRTEPLPCDAIASREPAAELLAARDDDHGRLVRAVANLPAPYRAIVERRFFAQESTLVIASDLGIAHASVRSRLWRAMNLLRQLLHAVLLGCWVALTGRRLRAARPVVAFGLALCVAGVAALRLHEHDVMPPEQVSVVLAPPAASPVTPPLHPQDLTNNRVQTSSLSRHPLPTLAPSRPSGRDVEVRFADGTPAAHVGLRLSTAGADFDLNVHRVATDDHGRVWLPVASNLTLSMASDRGPRVAVPSARDGEVSVAILPLQPNARQLLVLDVNGKPQADASVWVGDGPNAFSGGFIGKTDADGAFALPGLAAQTPVAAVDHGGWCSGTVPVRNATVTIVQLSQPGRLVAGDVVDEDGNAIVGARIAVPTGAAMRAVLPGGIALSDTPPMVAVSGKRGEFLATMARSQHLLLVRASGFSPTLLDTEHALPKGSRLQVAMRAGAKLAGTVTDSDGNPCANARVLVRGAVWYSRCGAFTDQDGQFAFDTLVPGCTEVEVQSGESPTEYYSVSLSSQAPVQLTCCLQAATHMRVSVRNADCQPVAGVEAAMRAPGELPRWVSRSDVTGHLALLVPSGPTQLVVRRGPQSPWIAIAAPASPTTMAIDPATLGTARVRCDIVDVTGQPVSLRGVACNDALGVSILAMQRSNRRWITGPLPAGNHELTLLPESSQVAALTIRVQDLKPGEDRDLGVLVAPVPVRCDIAVTGAIHRFEQRLFVLRNADGRLLAARTGSSGCQLAGPPGDHVLAVFGKHTEWRMGIPTTFASGTERLNVVLRRGSRRLLILRSVDELGPTVRVTLRRTQGSQELVYDDRLIVHRSSPLRIEPVLGTGHFLLLLSVSGRELGRHAIEITEATDRVDLTVTEWANRAARNR